MNRSFLDGTPEISVLISCYNAEKWVDKAVESILLQTYKDFELILVDDGSLDGTLAALEKLRGIDRRIVVIRKGHTGLSDSLNVGRKHAHGSWIARLDADDYCTQDRLEKQIEFAHSHPDVVLIGAGAVEIDAQGRTLKKHHYPTDHYRLVKNLERARRFFPHSTALFRADIFDLIGGYNARFAKAEDKRLWLDMSSYGKIASISECLVYLRRHTHQVSKANGGRDQARDHYAVLVCHFLRVLGQPDPACGEDAAGWKAFRDWLDERLSVMGLLDKEIAWSQAREKYHSQENHLIGGMKFIGDAMRAKNGGRLFGRNINASRLPMQLAIKWSERIPFLG